MIACDLFVLYPGNNGNDTVKKRISGAKVACAVFHTMLPVDYRSTNMESEQSVLLVRLFSVCAVVPIFITLFGVRPNFKTRTTAFYTF